MPPFEKDLFFWCNYLLLFTPIITFYFCNMLHLKKNCIWNKPWKLAVTFALCSILMYSFRFNPFLHMLMANSSIILLVLCAFEGPTKYKILCIVIFYLSSALAEILAWLLLIPIFQIPYQIIFTESWAAENHIYSTIGSGLVNILLLVFYSIIISVKRILSHQLKSRQLWMYAFLPIYQLILFCIYLYTYQIPDITIVTIGILILLLDILIDFIMISSIDNLIVKVAVKENLTTLYLQRQKELDYYQEVRRHIEDMRSVKHDFSNYLHTFHAMMGQGSRQQELNQFLMDTEEYLTNDGKH